MRFKSPLDKAFKDRHTAESGLPYCLTERMFDYNIMEVTNYVICIMKINITSS